MNVTRAELLAAYLRYGASAEPLRNRAYAQLAAKVLLERSSKEQLTVSQLRDGIAQLLGVGRPSKQDVSAALSFLVANGLARDRKDGRVQLTSKGRAEFERQLQARRADRSRVLDRHFGLDIPRETLAPWFDAAVVAFFTEFADSWVAGIATRTPFKPQLVSLESLLTPIIQEYGLEARGEDLLAGFREVIRPESPEESLHLWGVGLAMFAARFVAAGVAGDPISTRELRGSTILLDTNVLAVIALETHRHAERFVALGQALGEIGCQLRLTHVTKEEYLAMVDNWATNSLRSIDRYGPDVVRESTDEFIRTARARACVTRGDFERFFAELREIPGEMAAGVPIQELDDLDVARAAERGEQNTKRVNEIRNHWQERRARPKSEPAARHDSALTEVAIYLRDERDEYGWVLSLDRPLQDLALSWSGPVSPPLWLSLDSLLQVLAVESDGTVVEGPHFAQIMAVLISQDVPLPPDSYTVEDLCWLAEVKEGLDSLPGPDLMRMAQLIHRQRLQGAQRDDPELRLVVERELQRVKQDYGRELATHRAVVTKALEQRDTMERDLGAVQEKLLQERKGNVRRAARGRAIRRGVTLLIASMAALAAVIAMAVGLTPAALSWVVTASGILLPVAIAAVASWRSIFPAYRAEVEAEERRITREIFGSHRKSAKNGDQGELPL